MAKIFLRIGIVLIPLLLLLLIFCYCVGDEDGDSLSNGVVINEIMTRNFATLNDGNGISSDWIELYNANDYDVNLKNYSITNDISDARKYVFDNYIIPAHDYLVIFAADNMADTQNIYTQFGLDATSGSIYLYNSNGEPEDTFEYGEQKYDVSYGRIGGSEKKYTYFYVPTPGGENSYTIPQDEPPVNRNVIHFSIPGGIYQNQNLCVELTSDSDNDTILYTLDGSTPSLSSNIYVDGIPIIPSEGNDAVVIRAASYKDNTIGQTYTQTYIVSDREYALPYISISTDPDLLFDEEYGIYTAGNWAKRMKSYGVAQPFIGNYSFGDTIDINIETDTRLAEFNSAALLSMRGATSRTYAVQKSVKIMPESPLKMAGECFPQFVLRGSGNGEYQKHCKVDTFVQRAIADLDISSDNLFKPVSLFINGEYWGIYTLKESLDTSFFERRYDIDNHRLVSLEFTKNMFLEDGSEEHGKMYVALKMGDNSDLQQFVAEYSDILSRDFSNKSNYDWAMTKYDIDNLIDYIFVGVLFANRDWAMHNMVMWRTEEICISSNQYCDGKWRWLTYDFDTSLSPEDVEWDALDDLLSAKIDENNASHMTIALFQKLWDNDRFRDRFLARGKELLNTSLSEKELLQKFDSWIEEIEPDMPRNFEVLNHGFDVWKYGNKDLTSYDEWKRHVAETRDTIISRVRYFNSVLEKY